MPRKPRSFQTGAVYHLISRFIDHEWFITHARERACYLDLLGRALVRTDWQCLSYAVMSSHIHLAVVAGRKPLDQWIRPVHCAFADTVNKECSRIGALFVRGPRDIHVPSDRVGSLLAYIHNNPVRAGLVRSAAESDWTSHRAYLGLAPRPPWLRVDEGALRAGFSTPADLDTITGLAPDDPTRDERGYALRESEGEPVLQGSIPAAAAVAAEAIIEAVSTVTDVPIADLRSGSRVPAHSRARRVAVHCADAVGVEGIEIARALGISQQRASAISVRGVDSPDVKELVVSALRCIRAEVVSCEVVL